MTVPGTATVAVMPQPRPARAVQPSWDDLADLESSFATADSDPSAERFTPAPVARRKSSIPDWQLGQPYTSLAGEELIDAFLPWVMVGLFLVSAALVWYTGFRTFDTIMQAREANSPIPPDVKARATGYLYGSLMGMTVLPPLMFACLTMLATLLSSKILKFTPRAGSYARCLIVGITPSSVSFALQRLIGEEMAAPPLTFMVAAIATVAVMWLLTRYRLVHFAVTAGITLALMLVAVFGLIGVARLAPTNVQPQPVAQSPVYPPVQQPYQPAPSVPVANATGNPAVTQNNLHQIPPFAAQSPQQAPTREPRETPAPADSPDAQLLSKVADADKAYFAKYGRYPLGFPDLVREGSLKTNDRQSSPNHRLAMLAFIPPASNLPAEVLVAYIFDRSTQTYTALFGDWSIKTVSDEDWSLVRFRSSQTRRNMAKPASP